MLSQVPGIVGAPESLYRVILYNPNENSLRTKEGAINNFSGNKSKARLSMAKDIWLPYI